MTRANPLVLDGSEVKLRLQAERTAHETPVHVDWVRFTCLLRNVLPSFLASGISVPSVLGDRLFRSLLTQSDTRSPINGELSIGARCEVINMVENTLQKFQIEHTDPAFTFAAEQALSLANEICTALGPDFVVHHAIGKGHDFYKYRWSIHRNDTECGWVGFLSSGDSPRQQAQSSTIHANVYGSACTFASSGWNQRLADLIDTHEGKLTRADLALDFFDGGLDMDLLKDQYLSGAMDSGGKRLKTSLAGDWVNGAERSFYLGSKEAGKQTNVYEKGDQLFGVAAASDWVRIELRYGNKLRVLPSDILRRPADFFAGASDWHELQLAKLASLVAPQAVATQKRLPLQTIEAEVTRALRWCIQTAGPSMAMLFGYATESQIKEVLENKKLPARMSAFSPGEILSGFSRAIKSFSTVEGSSPAFA